MNNFIFTKLKWKKIKRLGIVLTLLLFILLGGVLAPLGVETTHAAASGVLGDTVAGIGSLLGSGADFIFGGLLNLVAVGARGIFNWFMVAGAFLLDMSVDYSIRSQHYDFPGIGNAWSIIRDVANMTFLFILVYIALATILQVSNFNTKQVLAMLLVIALLINFSFFLTGLVIDASNILALFFYNAITNDGANSISSQFANVMNIKTVFDKEAFDSLSFTKRSVANFMSAGVFLVAGFVFISGAILFILRTIALMFVLILSPIAFAAMILPKTRVHFNKWLHHLINYSFVAPMYILGTAVAFAMIPGMLAITGSPALSGVIQEGKPPSPEMFTIIMSFILVIGLLAGVLAISKDMAGKLATLSVQYAGKATGMAAGLAGFAGRNVIGRGAALARDSDAIKAMQTSKYKAVRYGGRAAMAATSYGAEASYDTKKGLQTGLGIAGIKTKLGKPGGKGGFDAQIKRRDEKRSRVASQLPDEAARMQYAKDIHERSLRTLIKSTGRGKIFDVPPENVRGAQTAKPERRGVFDVPPENVRPSSSQTKEGPAVAGVGLGSDADEKIEAIYQNFKKTRNQMEQNRIVQGAIKRALDEAAEKSEAAEEADET